MESHGQDPRLFTSKKDNSVHIILLTKHDTEEHRKKKSHWSHMINALRRINQENKVDY